MTAGRRSRRSRSRCRRGRRRGAAARQRQGLARFPRHSQCPTLQVARRPPRATEADSDSDAGGGPSLPPVDDMMMSMITGVTVTHYYGSCSRARRRDQCVRRPARRASHGERPGGPGRRQAAAASARGRMTRVPGRGPGSRPAGAGPGRLCQSKSLSRAAEAAWHWQPRTHHLTRRRH